MPTLHLNLNSSAFHRDFNVFMQICFGPHLVETEVSQHFVSYIWTCTCRDSLTEICEMLVNRFPCMFPSNAWAFIFCHFWQIAEHTHIFSLPLPHKLWLHMGKHSSPQECSKPQPTPPTHSRASHTEFPHMVSKSDFPFRGAILGRAYLSGMERLSSWTTLESAVTFCAYLPNAIVSSEHCETWWLLILRSEVATRWRGSQALLLSFPSIYSPLFICHLSAWLWNAKYVGAYLR